MTLAPNLTLALTLACVERQVAEQADGRGGAHAHLWLGLGLGLALELE